MDGDKFKAARKAMGLSVSQLADLLDVNRSTIFRMEERGTTRITELAMQRLADRWQGMATAPRNGEWILGACSSGAADIFRWNAKNGYYSWTDGNVDRCETPTQYADDWFLGWKPLPAWEQEP